MITSEHISIAYITTFQPPRQSALVLEGISWDTPHQVTVTVTTRILTFRIGDPYEPSLATLAGWGFASQGISFGSLKTHPYGQIPMDRSLCCPSYISPLEHPRRQRSVHREIESHHQTPSHHRPPGSPEVGSDKSYDFPKKHLTLDWPNCNISPI